MKSTETKEAAKIPAETAKPKVDGRPWELIDDDTPRNGTIIEVKADPDDASEPVQMAEWRITRRRDPELRRWAIVAYWANPLTKQELPFEPMVWRLPEGFRHASLFS